jgi:hypothetical protein
MDGKRTIEVHVGKPADVLEACAVGTSIPTTLSRLSGALGTCGWCRSLKLGNPDMIQIIISIFR